MAEAPKELAIPPIALERYSGIGTVSEKDVLYTRTDLYEEAARQRDVYFDVLKHAVVEAGSLHCLCEHDTLEKFGCHSEECKAFSAAIAECGEETSDA